MAWQADIAMKAVLWEEAKGKLRALAVAQGSYQSTDSMTEIWEKLDRKIEAFIKDIEDNALQE